MKLQKLAGATGEIWQVFIRDSSSTTGGGLTGLVFNSAGLTAYYHRDTDTTATAISLVTMTVGTFTSSGFKEIDSVNMAGWYQFCPPNAALASGAKSVGFHLKGATNMAPCPIEVQLLAVNLDSANSSITGINGVAPPTNWNLHSIDASGRVDVAKISGTSQTARDIGASVLLSSGTGTGQIDFTSGVVKANLAQILGTALTETAGQIAAGFKKFFNIATPAATMDHGVLVDTVTTYTGNTPQTGDSYARIGAAGASLTALGDTRIANLDATVSSRSTYAGGDTSGTTTLLSRLGSPVGATFSADIAAVAGNVWSVSTRLLTAGTNIALAKGTGVTGFTDLDAAGVRTAVGLASANLDTQLDALPTNTELAAGFAGADDATLAAVASLSSGISGSFTSLQSHGDSAWATATGFSTPTNVSDGTTTVTGAIAALTIPSASANAAAILAAAFEGAETVQDFFRLARASLYGKANGLAGTTVHYRDAADTKNRLTATVDADGNRSAVTVDAA